MYGRCLRCDKPSIIKVYYQGKNMTKKRFWILNVLTENSGIKDGDKLLSFDEVVYLLNKLADENEQLKSKLFDCNLELEYSKESVDDAYWGLTEIKKENEYLKKENQRLIKMLDNVANYMQKEHREIPLDDFVEWWNKMATEGLEND